MYQMAMTFDFFAFANSAKDDGSRRLLRSSTRFHEFPCK